MKLLIIKNGICAIDVDQLLLEIDQDIIMHITCSRSICYDELDISIYDGVIILGGAQRLSDMDEIERTHPYLLDLVSYIKKWMEQDIHILGICLGAQLIAIALGHDVVECDTLVCGYNQDMTLTESGQNDVLLDLDFELFSPYFLSLHSDYIKIKNNNLQILAESDGMPYAFRYRNTYGVQFHPDITLRILKTFCSEFNFDRSLIEEGTKLSNRSKISSIVFFINWLAAIDY